MRARMAAALIIMFLMATLVISGFTMSWFAVQDLPPTAASYLAGTVDIEITDEQVFPAEFRWEIKASEDHRDFTWTIQNTGSKRVFLRTWLEESLRTATETAWGEGERFGESGGWAMYFHYQTGSHQENNPKTVRLLAGQRYETGTVEVWQGTSGGIPTLFARYTSIYPLYELHLAVVDDLVLVPLASTGPKMGRFPFTVEFDGLENSYTFALPMQGTYPSGALQSRPYDWTGAPVLYIAAHAALISPQAEETGINWSQRPCSHEWTYYRGYWYYCLEPAAPGEEIRLCLTGSPEVPGLYTVRLFVEAVQALPEAVAQYWGNDLPCLRDN